MHKNEIWSKVKNGVTTGVDKANSLTSKLTGEIKEFFNKDFLQIWISAQSGGAVGTLMCLALGYLICIIMGIPSAATTGTILFALFGIPLIITLLVRGSHRLDEVSLAGIFSTLKVETA